MKKLLLLTMAAFCGLGSVGISRAAFAVDDPRRAVAKVVQNECPACTFINKPGAAQCEICGTPLMAGPAAGRKNDAAAQLGRVPDRQVAGSAAQQRDQGQLFEARDFFKDVVGISESAFRNKFGWDEKTAYLEKVPRGSRKEFEAWKRGFIAEFPRRQAIFDGEWSCETLGQLNARIAQEGAVRPLGGSRGQLNILLHNDPRGGKNPEITALQADPDNNGAVFQLASTFFGPLEGGMENPTASLTGMLHAPVQGEWASISAAGATIYRKYFMPTENFIRRHSEGKKDPNYFYLLHDLRKKAPQDRVSGKSPRVDLKFLKAYQQDASDAQQVGIFTHSNIATTSSCIRDQHKKENAVLQSIPLRNNQRVTQVLNSAYSLIDYYNQGGNNDNVINFAKMVLGAMYEGTLKSAYLLGQKKVYLTLLGGGAFVNDIAWIAEFFERSDIVEFIKNSGLDVSIVYRPDKARAIPVRSAQGDIDFLRRMYRVSGRIGGQKQDVMPAYIAYIEQSYAQLGGGAAAAVPARLPGQARPAADAGGRFENTCPKCTFINQLGAVTCELCGTPLMAGPAAGPAKLPRQAGPAAESDDEDSGYPSAAASRQVGITLNFEPILDTGKYFGLGWLYSPKHEDWALVSCGKRNCSPVLNQDGTKNFIYVSPGAPTVALPEGLYYWRSGGAFKVEELGKTEEKNGKYLVQVSNVPQREPFKWSMLQKGYVDLATRKKTWQGGVYGMDQDLLRQTARRGATPAAGRAPTQAAPRPAAGAVLPPAELQGLRLARATVKEETFPDGKWVGWLDVPEKRDRVRIRVTGSEIGRPGLGLNQYSNFYYIDEAGKKLPKGLFYWQTAQKVAPDPQAGEARLDAGGVWIKYKFGAKPADRGVEWDPTAIKKDHPWSK